MQPDLASRTTLLKSWLATLHGSELSLEPKLEALPAWRPLVVNAVSWHIAYVLMAYAGALAIARGGSQGAIAQAVQNGGRPALVILTLALWWGGVALTTALWWVKVRQARNR
jgi:hypothetical protein